MTKSGFDLDEIERLLAAATPGEWSTCIYDAGDCDHYDHNGPCPSVQAESADCAIVHWDGFKQEYWSSANGNQRQIEANAALIVAARNSLPAMLTEIRELRAENARLREGASWPSYDVDVPDAWESYLLELCGFEHRRGWAHLPATFRWHEFWERLGKTITARAALGEPQ